MKILLFASLMAVSSIANAMHGVYGAHLSEDHPYYGDRAYYGDRYGYNTGGGVSVNFGVAPGIDYWNNPYYPYNLEENNNYSNPGY